MLEFIWTAAILLGILVVALKIMHALLGDIGMALVLIICAISGVWAGWQWLVHNNHWYWQVTGWAIPVLLMAGIIWAVSLMVQGARGAKAEREVDGTATITDIEDAA